ncbi:MAG: methylated-DNA--[protein]-cysteine S-methyltransferase [Actinomycetota bacterium]|nr:methylated-DNA--[protein]-cysteine S-methyltransferase [Actinomycetota bacterium]
MASSTVTTGSPTGSTNARYEDEVRHACRVLEATDPTPSLAELADTASLSVSTFRRAFTAMTGLSPAAYARGARARRAERALAATTSVTDAIHSAGYGSSGRFYETSTARLGMSPTEWRAGGEGNRVRFAVAATSLGALLVAATDRGVCAIEFGDDPDALVRRLQDRFHAAELSGDDPDFDRLVAQVVALVEHPEVPPALPLDIHGTAFQERVWQALREVPPGTTVTYGELAERIGAPGAVRAVGSACGANRLAVAVPCHRVVRRDGTLSGYRWGVERKRALLERER